MPRLSRRALLAAGSTAAFAMPTVRARGQRPLSVTVAYAYPQLVQATLQALAERFMQLRPDIRIALQGAQPGYDELLQGALRGKLTDDLADVAFHGMHYVRQVAEAEVATPIDALVAAEPSWNRLGYAPAALSLASFRGKPYGIPFAISAPVVFYNADLAARAEAALEPRPSTWPSIIALGERIRATAGGAQGMVFDYYLQTNNWTFHALVQSFGGRMMSEDDRTIAFGGREGLEALRVLRDIGRAGMVDQTDAQSQQAFASGGLGVLVQSGARLGAITRTVDGRFRIATGRFPVQASAGRLPAGGMAPMLQTTDPARRAASWEFVKFVTGPVGQTLMVRNTGYMPSNTIPVQEPGMLGDFYRQNPNYLTLVESMPIVTTFTSFPGPNSLRIPVVIRDHLRAVVAGERAPEAALADMVRDVQSLLPRA